MNADVNKVMDMPDVTERFAEFGAQDGGGSPEQLDTLMKSEQRQWAKIIREGMITPDN